MNYVRTFYPQEDRVEASFVYRQNGTGAASFGLSGDNFLNFDVSGKFVSINNVFLAALDERKEVKFSVAGDNDNVTVWGDSGPLTVPFNSGFSFNSIFCNSPAGSLFTESVRGVQPTVDFNLSAWDHTAKSGNLIVTNSGQHNLIISGITLKDVYAYPIFSGLTVAPSGSGLIPLKYYTEAMFTGYGNFNLETNAGEYSFRKYFSFDSPKDFDEIEIFFDSQIGFPTGQSNFFIRNNGTQEKEVELFFDVVYAQQPTAKQGSATYETPSGVEFINYENSGFYKNLNGIGGFYFSVNEVIAGVKNFEAPYYGNFTGVGGRLDATGVQTKAGSASFSIYTEGDITYNYSIPVSSYILGEYATAIARGTLTGFVGTGSGHYHFNQQIISSVSSAYLDDGTIIYPNITDLFTGQLDRSIALEKLVSGDVPFYWFEDVSVYEGSGKFLEFWAVDYNDVDRGLENFVDSGRFTSSGFGVTGVTYRLPTGVTTSGQIRYVSDYSDTIFQRLNFRVTDYTSINSSLYINSFGNP